jgi:YNFM family putative membrane transporter
VFLTGKIWGVIFMNIDNNQQVIGKQSKHGALAIIATSLGSIIAFSNLYFVQPLLPTFVEGFNVGPTTASLTFSITVVGLMIGLFLFGFLSDRYGRVKMMKLTLVGVLLPLIFIPMLHSFGLFLLIRFIQGFFIAGLAAAAIPYLNEELDRKTVSIAIPIFIASNAVGGMFGRIFVGYLSDFSSWQSAVYLLFGVEVICFAFILFLLPSSKHFSPSNLSVKKDLKGMLIHLKNPILIPAFLLGILMQISFTGIWTYLPFYLSEEPYLLSIKEISLTYSAYIFGIIGSPAAGKLAQTFNKTTIIFSGALILICGAFLTLLSSMIVVFFGLGLVCLGFFIAHSMTAAYVSLNANHHKGGASSLYLISYYLGVALGGSAVGYVWIGFSWVGIVALSLLSVPIVYSLRKNR